MSQCVETSSVASSVTLLRLLLFSVTLQLFFVSVLCKKQNSALLCSLSYVLAVCLLMLLFPLLVLSAGHRKTVRAAHFKQWYQSNIVCEQSRKALSSLSHL